MVRNLRFTEQNIHYYRHVILIHPSLIMEGQKQTNQSCVCVCARMFGFGRNLYFSAIK